MEKYEIEKLRELPIEGVAERLGLRVARHKCLCPFHNDHHASLSFNTRRNSCRCFVCMEQSVGTIDLVMRLMHTDFPKACRWLADTGNVYLSEERRGKSEETNSQHSTLNTQHSFDASRYIRFFERPWLSNEARRFLFEERHIDPRVAAWCRLTSWQDHGGTHWLQIPYYSIEGKLIGVQNRNLDYSKGNTKSTGVLNTELTKYTEGSLNTNGVLNTNFTNYTNVGGTDAKEQKPRFRFPYGAKCGIYNLPVVNRLRQGDELFITEGCSDCWAMLSSGHKAIAIPSATLLSHDDRQLLADLSHRLAISWHMYPDQDAPGERLFLQLREILPSLQHHQLPPGCKDYGEFFKGKKVKE